MIEPIKSTTSGSQLDLSVQEIRNFLEEWQMNDQKGLFEKQTSAIRRVIESINSTKDVFLELNGIPRFKCSKFQCENFAFGFEERQARDSHINEHELPFKCPNEGCYARTLGYSSRLVLDAHVKRLHSDNTNSQPLFPPSVTKKVDIFTASAKGDLDAVKKFLYQGVDVNAPSQRKGQLTPLVWAARNGHIPVCQYLIQRGAKVYPPDSTKNLQGATTTTITVLGEAIKRRDYELFRVLVETAGDEKWKEFLNGPLNSRFHDYIRESARNGDVKITRYLLSRCENDSNSLNTILLGALEWEAGACETIFSQMDTELIAQVNGFKDGLLCRAIVLKNRDLVRLLLEAGVDAGIRDTHGQSILHQACTMIDDEVSDNLVAMLLNHTHEINSLNNAGETTLYLAVTYGQVKSTRRLLEAGADANIKNEHGRLPLHQACTIINDEISDNLVAVLLDYTDEIDSLDGLGDTPLHLAVRYGQVHSARRLLKTGRVDIMKRNQVGDTIFSTAAGVLGSAAMIQLICSMNESVLQLGDHNCRELTPLHEALVTRRLDHVELLLSLPDSDKLIKDWLANEAFGWPQQATDLFSSALKVGKYPEAITIAIGKRLDLSLNEFNKLQEVFEAKKDDPKLLSQLKPRHKHKTNVEHSLRDTLAWWAVTHRSKELFESLIDAGSEVSLRVQLNIPEQIRKLLAMDAPRLEELGRKLVLDSIILLINMESLEVGEITLECMQNLGFDQPFGEILKRDYNLAKSLFGCGWININDPNYEEYEELLQS
jgi:ankyrin repeat protein